MPERGSPNLARRRRLAVELRRLREHAGLTADEATRRLSWPSSSKLSRLELGKTGVKLADLQHLLDLYHVSAARRAELMDLGKESRTSGAAQGAGSRLPEEHVALLETQADAESIWLWAPQVVPGLFQTENYARVLLQAWVARFALPSGEVDRRLVARRLQRDVLTRDPPPRLSAVLDESVLVRRVGEAADMREQLEQLAAISALPHVDMRILPLNSDHMETAGAFVYLKFHRIHAVPLHDLVSYDHLTGMEEVDAENDVNQYSVIFRSLTESALGPEESRALIMAVVNEAWKLSDAANTKRQRAAGLPSRQAAVNRR
ncbi:MAG TPA: helix-turn-helix transcriptional regulator [Streptosporangiaceae bacterium]|jgi:transcriptional regulator with XRE-family HTH domain|nr:helix-turn-helix transcriptional regulator [Streptosporangiaceae bacterium]HEX2822539.1 helix-turn-helix transcriptional regulator [Streptosporangiaceae bacterium]